MWRSWRCGYPYAMTNIISYTSDFYAIVSVNEKYNRDVLCVSWNIFLKRRMYSKLPKFPGQCFPRNEWSKSTFKKSFLENNGLMHRVSSIRRNLSDNKWALMQMAGQGRAGAGTCLTVTRRRCPDRPLHLHRHLVGIIPPPCDQARMWDDL